MNQAEILLNKVFEKMGKQYIPRLKDISKTNSILVFLRSSVNQEKDKVNLINLLISIFQKYRLICHYFSTISNRPIYLHLIDLYLNNKPDSELCKAILRLIDVLILSIQTNKDIYDYIYQKMAILYRDTKNLKKEQINGFIHLLQRLFGNVNASIRPRNYISLTGKGGIEVLATGDKKLYVNSSLTFILNFKTFYDSDLLNYFQEPCNLINITFANGKNFKVQLKNLVYIIIPSFRESVYATVSIDQYTTIIITLFNSRGNLDISLLVNEYCYNKTISLKNFSLQEPIRSSIQSIASSSSSFSIKEQLPSNFGQISSIVFFEKFIGEVTSIMAIEQPTDRDPCLDDNSLSVFKDFPTGQWKKSIIQKIEEQLASKGIKVETEKKSFYNKRKGESNIKKLTDNIEFLFTPLGYNNKILEDFKHRFKAALIGDDEVHNYQIYQKKIHLIGGAESLLPFIELIFLNQNLIDEDSLLNLLILVNCIATKSRFNLENMRNCHFFEVLSLFIEKLPTKFFSTSVLVSLSEIGNTILKPPFKQNIDLICPSFFEDILFNEKIISKYDQQQQIAFWSTIDVICKNDRESIKDFINMNKIAMILLYYDQNRYSQWCCKDHYDIFKVEFAGCATTMKPQMPDKLNTLQKLLLTLLVMQEADGALILFQLLLLDISPCLSKCILKILTCSLSNQNNFIWSKNIVEAFLKYNDTPTIIANLFAHSIPEIRFHILEFLFEVYKILQRINTKELSAGFEKILKMLKTCLIPGEMFTELKSNTSGGKNEIKSLAEHCAYMLKNRIIAPSSKCFNDSVSVFKDNIYNSYLTGVNKILLQWATDRPFKLEEDEVKTKLEKMKLRSDLSIFKLLLSFSDQLNSKDYTKDLMKNILALCNVPENCVLLVNDKVILSWILSTTFECIQSNDSNQTSVGEKGKTIIYDLFAKSLVFERGQTEKERNGRCSISNLETVFHWGDRVRGTLANEGILFQFIKPLLEKLLDLINKELKPFNMNNDVVDGLKSGDIYRKEYLNRYGNRTYLMFVTFVFKYSLYYTLESKFAEQKMLTLNNLESGAISLPEMFIKGMRFENSSKSEKSWSEYFILEDLIKKFDYYWGKTNTIKKQSIVNEKTMLKRTNKILSDIIMNKNQKNIYIKEMCLFTFSGISLEEKDMEDKIIPLTKIIPICIALILIKNMTQWKDKNIAKKWLKHFKNFIRLIIIGSSNCIAKDQEEIYNDIQDKCVDAIAFSLCFLSYHFSLEKKTYNPDKIIEEKFEKTIRSLMCLCISITCEQYQHNEGHQSVYMKITKALGGLHRNDLSYCAAFQVFNDYFVTNTGEPFVNRQMYEALRGDNFNAIPSIFAIQKEWQDYFICNKNLKTEIYARYLGFMSYSRQATLRFDTFSSLDNVVDDTYKKEVFNLIPRYSAKIDELINKSFFDQRIKCSYYKKIKKKLFSWKGTWSDRLQFYQHFDTFKKRILNHYTKSLSRPVLVPILDIDYYVPNFTYFKIDNLFLKDKKPVNKVNLDVDSILISKLNEEELPSNKSNNTDSHSASNYLKEIYRKSSPELSYLYISLAKVSSSIYDEDINDAIKQQQRLAKHKIITDKDSFKCCFVKPSHHIKGELILNDSELHFKVLLNQKNAKVTQDEDYDSERNTCFGSYFVWHHKDLDLISFELKYEDISFFLRKRYYYKNTAMEVFSSSNKSYYFNFKDERQRENAIKIILQKMKDPTKIINDLRSGKDKFDNILGYSNQSKKGKKIKKYKLSQKVSDWANWEISNFEMLMWLNLYSNRSYSDISQYPVFPWIFNCYENNMKICNDENFQPDFSYRDLSQPMGMLDFNDESEARKELFIEMYNSMKECEESQMKPYAFGSHYSNPVYVCNYLMRLFPFSHILIELQGNKFDNPDRLFISVENSFKNSTSQKTDLRELIPEFYFLPEMFVNINGLNFGKLETGKLVNDVTIPCDNNPYDFVMTLKQALENKNVSEKIQLWINIIFGYQQRGKEAEKIYNIFSESSYEDQVNINSSTNKNAMFRMVEFGLTPSQTVSDKFQERKKYDQFRKKELTDINNEFNTIYLESGITTEFSEALIIKMEMFENDKVILLYDDLTFCISSIKYSILDKKYSVESKVYNFHLNKLSGKIGHMFKNSIANNSYLPNSQHIAFYNKGKSVAIGGFYDGKISLVTIDPQDLVGEAFYKADPSPITVICIDKEEEHAFCGNMNGNLLIYSILSQIRWSLCTHICEDFSPILSIYSSDELNLWACSTFSGYISIFTAPSGDSNRGAPILREVRSLKLTEKYKGDYVFLSSSPLPSIVVIDNTVDLKEGNEKSSIIVYPLNGNLLKIQKEDEFILSPCIMRDMSFIDYLVYAKRSNIYIRFLPNLDIDLCIDFDQPYEIGFIGIAEKGFYSVNQAGDTLTRTKVKDIEEVQPGTTSNQ